MEDHPILDVIAGQMEIGAELSHAYISLSTGGVCRVHEFDADSVYSSLAQSGLEMIPNLPSQDLYLWMLEFAGKLKPGPDREKLLSALSGISAVWKFRNILYHNDVLSAQWEHVKRQKLLQTARSWFESVRWGQA